MRIAADVVVVHIVCGSHDEYSGIIGINNANALFAVNNLVIATNYDAAFGIQSSGNTLMLHVLYLCRQLMVAHAMLNLKRNFVSDVKTEFVLSLCR